MLNQRLCICLASGICEAKVRKLTDDEIREIPGNDSPESGPAEATEVLERGHETPL